MPRQLTKTKAAVPQRWEVFSEEFLVDLNATRAAERAGYSKKGAEQRGYELLRDEKVKSRIADLMARRAERVGLSQQQIVQELCDQLSVSLPDVVTWGPNGLEVKDSAALTGPQRKALKKVKVKKVVRETESADGKIHRTISYDYEVELHDRVSVIEMAGRHLGMWKEAQAKPSVTSDFQGVSDEQLQQELKEIRALRVRNTPA
jgi:phage terminase small subunit